MLRVGLSVLREALSVEALREASRSAAPPKRRGAGRRSMKAPLSMWSWNPLLASAAHAIPAAIKGECEKRVAVASDAEVVSDLLSRHLSAILAPEADEPFSVELASVKAEIVYCQAEFVARGDACDHRGWGDIRVRETLIQTC